MGKVFDADTLEPIPNVEVKLKITKPFLQEQVHTDSAGEFEIEYSGDIVLFPDIFLDEEDLKVAERKIEVDLIHSEFIADTYEEERECQPAEIAKFDVGAFYLQKKEEFDTKPALFMSQGTETP